MGTMMANFRAAERAVAEERALHEAAMRKAMETSLVTQMEDDDEDQVNDTSKRAVDGGASSGIGARIKALMAVLGCKGNASEAVDEQANGPQKV